MEGQRRAPLVAYKKDNFVQEELANLGIEPSFSWKYTRSEIEFLYKENNGDIFPIEVKSGKIIRAKSLDVYVQRYQSKKMIKLIG